jgi:chromate reductase
MSKLNILAICGSTRKESSNMNLIKAIATMAADTFAIDVFQGLSILPQFNPDEDNEQVAPVVTAFRAQLTAADGVLICTPEYALGVPGTLKNAIDWTVSSMSFSKKPVALITASLSGERAHQSLLSTMLIIESKMTDSTQLLVPYVKSKVNAGGITDSDLSAQVQKLINALVALITTEDTNLLSESLLLNDGVNSGRS